MHVVIALEFAALSRQSYQIELSLVIHRLSAIIRKTYQLDLMILQVDLISSLLNVFFACFRRNWLIILPVF